MGNLRQKMTDEEWNELGLPSKKTLLDIIDLDGHPDTITAIIDHPKHYGGANNEYEAIKVIEAWDLGFNLGNVVKYVARAGKKEGNNIADELKKARWYLEREINKLS
jgi:hypothetical protein